MIPTLIHAPLACSLAAAFTAAEGGLDISIKRVDLQTKELEGGGSLFDYNPLGQVSVLLLEGGEILTETGTVIAWLQANATDRDYRVEPHNPKYFAMLRWISFCATELHKQIFRVVFYPEATEEVKEKIRRLAPKRFELLDTHLSNQKFLLGDQFSAADCYLAWFFVLAERAQVNPSAYPHLETYRQRVLARPHISRLIAEDLKSTV